jgi:hypothetical protein
VRVALDLRATGRGDVLHDPQRRIALPGAP